MKTIQIIPWLIDGLFRIIGDAFEALSEKYHSARRIQRTWSKDVVYVNRDASRELPENLFTGESGEVRDRDCSRKKGWVKVERQRDQLYLDDKVVLLDFRKVERWKHWPVEIWRRTMESPNVLDALVKHPNLFPDEWKGEEKGPAMLTLFWDVRFWKDGKHYVRGLSWDWENAVPLPSVIEDESDHWGDDYANPWHGQNHLPLTGN